MIDRVFLVGCSQAQVQSTQLRYIPNPFNEADPAQGIGETIDINQTSFVVREVLKNTHKDTVRCLSGQLCNECYLSLSCLVCARGYTVLTVHLFSFND